MKKYLEFDLLGGFAEHDDVGEEVGHHFVLGALVEETLPHVSAAGLGQINLRTQPFFEEIIYILKY
jgi:hypothetical protein